MIQPLTYAGPAYPEINLDSTNGRFLLKGNSFMLDPQEFYKPLIEQLKTTLSQSSPNIGWTIELYLDYYDTNSFQYIEVILTTFQETQKQVNVCWRLHPKDERVAETVSDLKQSFPKLTFCFSWWGN